MTSYTIQCRRQDILKKYSEVYVLEETSQGMIISDPFITIKNGTLTFPAGETGMWDW